MTGANLWDALYFLTEWWQPYITRETSKIRYVFTFFIISATHTKHCRPLLITSHNCYWRWRMNISFLQMIYENASLEAQLVNNTGSEGCSNMHWCDATRNPNVKGADSLELTTCLNHVMNVAFVSRMGPVTKSEEVREVFRQILHRRRELQDILQWWY